jgi:hypothetical protein
MEMTRTSFIKSLFGIGLAATLPSIPNIVESKSTNSNNFRDTLRKLRLDVNEVTVGLYYSILNGKLISSDDATKIRTSIDNLNKFAFNNSKNHSTEINNIGWDWQRINALTYANSFVLECEPNKALDVLKNVSQFNNKFPFSFSKEYPNSIVPANSFMKSNWESLGRTFLQFDEKELAIECFETALTYGKLPLKKLIKDLKDNKPVKITYSNPDYDKWVLTQRFI